MSERLGIARLGALPGGVRRPGYAPQDHGVGIVHLGLGAFHRAHQAVCTDDALATDGGDWRIRGVSLRGADVADALNPQDGLYTLLVQGAGGTEVRVIASIAGVISERREPGAALAAMAAPGTRIVSLTVTEKAYGGLCLGRLGGLGRAGRCGADGGGEDSRHESGDGREGHHGTALKESGCGHGAPSTRWNRLVPCFMRRPV
jgi:fructuronate reductase